MATTAKKTFQCKTVGALKKALADLPDRTPITMGFSNVCEVWHGVKHQIGDDISKRKPNVCHLEEGDESDDL